MNAPLLGSYAPPKEGAIYLANDSPLGRTGQYVLLDGAGGGVLNLNSGQGTPIGPLPMAGGRSGASYQFAGGGAPPRPSDVHYPQVIAGWLGGYRNAAYLLDTLVQQQPTARSTFVHRDHASSDTYLVRNVEASMLSAPPQVQTTTATTERTTLPLRVAVFIPYLSEYEADFDLYTASARVAQNQIDLWREYKAFKSSGLFTTSGNWASTARLDLGATGNWGPPGSEGADSDPPRDLMTAARTSFGDGIAYWCFSRTNYEWFLSHPKTVDWYNSKGPAGITAGYVKSVIANEMMVPSAGAIEFTIPLIGRGIVHAARATVSTSVAADYFFPNDVVLGFSHAPTMPPNASICTAVTFQHTNPSNGSPSSLPGMSASMPTNNGTLVRLVDMPLLGSGGRLLILDRSELTAFTANNAGAIIYNVS